jgi:hypothetical protein
MVDPPSGSVKQTKLCVSILYRLAHQHGPAALIGGAKRLADESLRRG